MLTTASPWENGQTQHCKVARNGFKSNVAMPLLSGGLVPGNTRFIQLFPLLRVDHADLVILDTYLSA